MKFLAAALDFDGTIANADILDSEVRKAIEELRSQNTIVLIVTGRILSDLKRVVGDLHFVDAVVAENGAAIYFPESGYLRLLADPAPQALVQAIRLEGGVCQVGECVIEADAKESTRILSTLQRLELPLSLAFNRARVMVLPQAISKATGLREVFKILRVSAHNAVAFGDAENDHELLRSCEYGVAVEWGSSALKAAADFVLPGKGPPAVAEFLRTLASAQHIPTSPRARRNLVLGRTDAGVEFSLRVRDRTVLIAGDTKSGKSWATGLLCEQLILYGYSLLIIDPEGDYVSLETLPGVIVFGGVDPLPRPRDLIRALRHADVSLVIDLSHTPHKDRVEYVRNLLLSLRVLREYTGLPHCVVLDEAHYFLGKDEGEKELLDLQLGFCLLVSYRTSWLHPAVLKSTGAILITRESDPNEVRTLRVVCGPRNGSMSEPEWVQMFSNLALAETVALPITEESRGQVMRIRLAPRLTPHIRHMAKYIDIPVPEKQRFVFWNANGPSGQYARTLHQLVSVLEEGNVASFDRHMEHHDFSRWIADVFGDYALAKNIEEVEGHFQKSGSAQCLQNLIEAIRVRYEIVDPLRSLQPSNQ